MRILQKILIFDYPKVDASVWELYFDDPMLSCVIYFDDTNWSSYSFFYGNGNYSRRGPSKNDKDVFFKWYFNNEILFRSKKIDSKSIKKFEKLVKLKDIK